MAKGERTFRIEQMKFHHFDELGSTNDQLLEMAEKGAPEWSIVTADRQTSGRGRGAKEWWSPGGNLYMSILLKPDADPGRMLRLPMIASLAFLSAMGNSGSRLKIKWPNDILFEGRKLAGILVESRSEGKKILWAVVGFGVNMVRTNEPVPAKLNGRMAFVQELAKGLSPGDLALRIANGVKRWSGAMKDTLWEKAMEEWSRRALLNIPYTWKDGQREVSGLPVRLDRSGGLVMKTEEGEMIVYSGEIERSV
jgi:BirA family biotin operon repressor/biotin-[acetyl-CoA-carboxylase] ligase